MLIITELFIYPIKSLGGISLKNASLTDRGFKYDRRWMLVDSNNRFLSQRELPQMALLQVDMSEKGLIVKHKNKDHAPLFIPLEPEGESCMVSLWEDCCKGQWVNNQADDWFCAVLSVPCRLVYMPDTTHRHVDGRYAINKEITSFSDGYPLLLIGQASLDDLNKRLSSPVPMNRFRPNIVFLGGEPYQEDEFKRFQVGGISFYGAKRCARCLITTIDQDTMVRSKEPLQTLNDYRRRHNKIYFGQNLLYQGEGTISVGDPINLQTDH